MKTLESPLDSKEIIPVNPKGNESWVFTGRTDAEAETPILWSPDAKNWLIGKDPDAGKDWRQKEKGTTEDEMVGWHHRLDGHEFEQALRVGERQGSLECCSPWGHKEADTTEQLNWTEPYGKLYENWQVTFLHLQLGASGTVLSLSLWLHWAVHLTQPCIPEKGLERKSRHCCHSIYQSKVFQHRYTF